MKKATIFPLCIFFSITLCLLKPSLAGGYATEWKDTTESMSALINGGWKIVSSSSSHAIANPSFTVRNVNAASTGLIVDGTYGPQNVYLYNYLLFKDGKYVSCYIRDNQGATTYSFCRHIN
jgi:hypothetical protein